MKYAVDKLDNLVRRYRFFIVWSMVFAAITHAAFRFWGEWWYFFSVLLAHFLPGQAVQAYLYGKTMSFGGGGPSAKESREFRLVFCVFLFVLYLSVFVFGDFVRGAGR